MTYAIIGTGLVGATLARFFAAKTIPVLIANSRGSELTAELDASVNPVTVDEAVEADIILVALVSVAYKKGLPHMTVYSSGFLGFQEFDHLLCNPLRGGRILTGDEISVSNAIRCPRLSP